MGFLPAADGMSRAARLPAPCQRPAALIVDAHADTRALHRVGVAGLARFVEEACDGVEALGRALVRPPDLLITELWLPRMDGFTLIERFRAIPLLSSSAVLVVTGTASGGDLHRALALGADALFVKPCDFDALVTAARDLLAPRDRGLQPRPFPPAHERLPDHPARC